MDSREGPPPVRRQRSGEDTRGQTTTDFAVGAGVFLIAVGFTFAFVPGLMDPFVGGAGQDRAVVADRLASDLAGGALGDPAEPYKLDLTCTLEFFRQINSGTAASNSCRFDARSASATIGAALDIEDLDDANVTLERNVDSDDKFEIVCRDGTSSIDDDCSSSTTLVAAGDAPPDTASVVAAQRSVAIDGTDYSLIVRVW